MSSSHTCASGRHVYCQEHAQGHAQHMHCRCTVSNEVSVIILTQVWGVLSAIIKGQLVEHCLHSNLKWSRLSMIAKLCQHRTALLVALKGGLALATCKEGVPSLCCTTTPCLSQALCVCCSHGRVQL